MGWARMHWAGIQGLGALSHAGHELGVRVRRFTCWDIVCLAYEAGHSDDTLVIGGQARR